MHHIGPLLNRLTHRTVNTSLCLNSPIQVLSGEDAHTKSRLSGTPRSGWSLARIPEMAIPNFRQDRRSRCPVARPYPRSRYGASCMTPASREAEETWASGKRQGDLLCKGATPRRGRVIDSGERAQAFGRSCSRKLGGHSCHSTKVDAPDALCALVPEVLRGQTIPAAGLGFRQRVGGRVMCSRIYPCANSSTQECCSMSPPRVDQPLGEGRRRWPPARVPVFVSRLAGLGLIFAELSLRHHGASRTPRAIAVRGEGG
jgi:hypothetical protein